MIEIKRFLPSLALICVVLFSGGCKPTENNYRAAYDAAKNKREKANEEQFVPTTGLLNDEGISMKVVEGDTLYVTRDRLSRNIDNPDLLKTYNVAVGVYKMNTNAKAQAQALADKGYPAFAVQTTGDRWYAIAASFDTLEEARKFIADFRKKNPGYPYIGLPGAPVITGK